MYWNSGGGGPECRRARRLRTITAAPRCADVQIESDRTDHAAVDQEETDIRRASAARAAAREFHARQDRDILHRGPVLRHAPLEAHAHIAGAERHARRGQRRQCDGELRPLREAELEQRGHLGGVRAVGEVITFEACLDFGVARGDGACVRGDARPFRLHGARMKSTAAGRHGRHRDRRTRRWNDDAAPALGTLEQHTIAGAVHARVAPHRQPTHHAAVESNRIEHIRVARSCIATGTTRETESRYQRPRGSGDARVLPPAVPSFGLMTSACGVEMHCEQLIAARRRQHPHIRVGRRGLVQIDPLTRG